MIDPKKPMAVVEIPYKCQTMVLNADDAMCVQMAELCDGEVIFFSENPDSEVIRT